MSRRVRPLELSFGFRPGPVIMLHLRLLGALDLTGAGPRPDSTTALLSQPKRAALLAYLAVAGTGCAWHRRDALLAMFWPELDEVRGRRALNQALYFLRGCLGAGVIVARGDDEVSVDATQLSCDVVQLRAHAAAGALEEALVLYHGPLLPAFHAQASNDFQDWLDAQRRSLADVARDAALTLSARVQADNRALAIHWARSACEIAPLDERCAQQLIRLLMDDGNAATARAEYARFAERLQGELEVEPSDATRALLDLPVGMAAANADTTARPKTSPDVAKRPARSRPLVAAAAVGLLLLLTIAAQQRWTNPVALAHGEGKRPTILVADFTGPSSDSALGDVATQLAVSALQDSRTARATWSGEEQHTLQRMKLRAGTPMRDSVAREVAVREGYGAVLQGFVRESKGELLVGLSLVEPSTNHVLFMRSAAMANAGTMTATVDQLMRDMRSRIGDASEAIKDTRPLAQVTTSSLEALRIYTASHAALMPDRRRRIAMLERAVQLDTSFAAAYRRLGVDLYWEKQQERSSEMLRKALENSARLTEADRELAEATLYAKGRYYDPERALAAFNAILARNPSDPVALDNKAWLLMQLRQYEEAARMYRSEIGDSNSATYGLLARASFAAGRPDDGWRAVEMLVARDSGARVLRARYELLTGRLDSAEADLRRALATAGEQKRQGRDVEVEVAVLRASMARRRGKLTLAHQLDAVRKQAAAARHDAREMALAVLVRLRESSLLLHRPDLVRRDIDELRRLVESLHGVDRPVGVLAISYVDAGDIHTADSLLREAEKIIAPGEWGEIAASLHYARSQVDLAQGRAMDALRELRLADVGVCSACLLAATSFAYEQAGMIDSALATGERYLSAIDPALVTYDGHYRPILHHRLGRLYLRRGDPANAARHLEAFIDMWRDADEPLRPQVDSARRELALARSMLTHPRQHGT